ncbi:hypothetical protein O9993_07685 [Vibrio lentus]|nr:hypothetical protein [Vibrio lentus]
MNKLLEDARKRKQSVVHCRLITLYADDALAAKINKLEDELRFVLITSAAVVKP